MEKVVLKPYNLPEQLQIWASELSEQERPFIFDLFNETYEEDPLPEKKMNPIRINGSLKEITVAQCTEEDRRVQYRGK